ncbi:MAG: response regulator, partial [Coleofasciculus sp. C3-bin4]|nr:response regulator [Coleofasciculus sp. C3-bin4]
MSTVLVVEDSLAQRQMISDLLKGSGLTVTVASDGVEALEHIQRSSPDVVVLDIVMP